MKTAKLGDMKKGYFIGDFEPSLYKTGAFEAAVKTYNKGDYEECHYHKIAVEYTVIIQGKARMNGALYEAGDIIIMEPGESTDFEALADGTVNVVVKIPSISGDKYTGEMAGL